MRWLSFMSRRVSTTMFRYLCLRGISCTETARGQQPPSSWAALLLTRCSCDIFDACNPAYHCRTLHQKSKFPAWKESLRDPLYMIRYSM